MNSDSDIKSQALEIWDEIVEYHDALLLAKIEFLAKHEWFAVVLTAARPVDTQRLPDGRMEWQAFFQACRGEVEFIAPDVEVFDRVTDESKGSALIAQLPDDFLVVSEDLAMVVSDALVHVVVGSQGALARFLGDSLSALGPLLDRWRRDTKKYSVEARITERIIDHTKPRWLMGFHPAFPN